MDKGKIRDKNYEFRCNILALVVYTTTQSNQTIGDLA